jgi:hypothetical protein
MPNISLRTWGCHKYDGWDWPNPFAALDSAVLSGDLSPRLEFVFPLADEIDWSVEPIETLDDLYRERAKRLRSECDYLILMYSGGSDSHQILMTCLKHGIFLNEVRTCFPMEWVRKVSGKTSKNDPLGMLYEFANAVAPGLNAVSVESPMTRIVVKDTTDAYTSEEMNEWCDALWGSRMSGGLHGLYQAIRRTRMARDLQRDAEKINSKVNVIIGAEKPPLHLEGENLYVVFSDIGRIGIEHFWQHGSSLLYEPHMFYWGEPRIVCKQAHKIKRLLDIDPTIISNVNAHRHAIYPDLPSHYQSEPIYGSVLAECVGPRAAAIATERTSFYNTRYKDLTTVEKMTDVPPEKGHLKRSLLLSCQSKRYHIGKVRIRNLGRAHDHA